MQSTHDRLGPVRLDPITRDNLRAALGVAVRPDQERLVAPVAVSLAEAYVEPTVAWPRLVRAGETPVGFVMGGFDPEDEMFASTLWRLNIDAAHQGRGYGRLAVEEVAAEARRRGHGHLATFYVPEDGGPGAFYRRLGFEPTGELVDGEVRAVLDLS